MKSSKKSNSKLRYQMRQLQQQQQQTLSKETQKTLQKYEHAVICLLILIAVCSIIWSATVYHLTTDFTHGVIGAKLVFTPRDFSQLDEKAKEVFYNDLILLNKSYSEAALEIKISRNAHGLPEEPTEKSKFKTVSVAQSNSEQKIPEKELNAVELKHDNATIGVLFDLEKDQQFLATMTIDVHQTRWRRNIAVQFIYSFPFLSEIISIVWTAMCLVFHTNGNKYWGLPKPWRIVVPSIFTFSVMSVSTTIYTLLANKYLTDFCTQLSAPLSNPNVLSCGQVVSVLRPEIIPHRLCHDVYLTLLRTSYTLALILWLLALLIVTLRFTFAIDFRCVEVAAGAKRNVRRFKTATRPRQDRELDEQLLNAAAPDRSPNPPPSESQKSEDDFQSAKSQHSEVGSPLLTKTTSTMPAEQQQQQQESTT